MGDYDSINNNNINKDYHSNNLNNNSINNCIFKDNSADRDKISTGNNKSFGLIDREK